MPRCVTIRISVCCWRGCLRKSPSRIRPFPASPPRIRCSGSLTISVPTGRIPPTSESRCRPRWRCRCRWAMSRWWPASARFAMPVCSIIIRTTMCSRRASYPSVPCQPFARPTITRLRWNGVNRSAPAKARSRDTVLPWPEASRSITWLSDSAA